MPALLDQVYESMAADETEAAIARKAADKLAAAAASDRIVSMHVEGAANVAVPLPASAVQMMLRMLTAMAERRPVSMIPHEAELSTTQAADFLNVSRPYVCKLVDEGKLKARKINRHRRVRFSDLLAYEAEARGERLSALAEMQKEARELGLE